MKPKKWLIFLVMIVTACAGAVTGEDGGIQAKATQLPTPVQRATPTQPTATAVATDGEPATATATPTPTVESPSATAEVGAPDPGTPTATPGDELGFLPEEPPPGGAEREFITDFSKHTVSYREILSGGPPKDGIPAIDAPQFVTVKEADEWLQPQEPVILFELNRDARAYPLQILTWHEIVNDEVGGVPVTITFCPLCNTGIAFERTFEGQVLDFGTTGRLRYSNLIMYDRQTETWWQQASGDGIAGEHAGKQLTFLPASIIGWGDFKTAHPEGQVLSRDTGFNRPYGRNPYGGYDDVNESPFLYLGPRTPGQLPPMARVLTVDLDAEAVAYPYDVLQQVHVINDTIADEVVVVIWQPGVASALDAGTVAGGRDVGAGAAFQRELDGQTLDFRFDGDKIVDEQTGSEWNVVGQAVSGPLSGSQLTPVVSVNHFWFSWAAFRPDTRIYEAN